MLCLGKKSVSFAPVSSVPVYHWDSCQRKDISVEFLASDAASSSSLMSAFYFRIGLAFFEEKLGKNYRLYTLPRDFNDVVQRSRIESWEDVLQYLTVLRDDVQSAAWLYVFNDDASPTKLPEKKMVQRHDGASSDSHSQSSKSSRDKDSAESARDRDGETCVFCGYTDASSREAAHLFELKSCRGTKAEKKSMLFSLVGLEDINSISNMISLCRLCHRKFDSYAIGIDPKEKEKDCYTLKISRSIFDDVTQGGIPFRQLHNKTLKFRREKGFYPEGKLLVYRFKLFTDREEELGQCGEGDGNAIGSLSSSAKSSKKRKISKTISSSGDNGNNNYKNKTMKKARNCCSRCHSTRSGSSGCAGFVSTPSHAGCDSCGHLEKYHT